MTQLQALKQKVLKEKVQVFYDKKGKPQFILLPFKQFKILEETAAQKFYDLTDREIVKIVDEVREKLFQERYAQKVKALS